MPIVLAHPLTEPGGLPVAPAFVAALVLCVVVAAGRVGRRPGGPARVADDRSGDRLTAAQVVTRTVGVGLLVLSIGAGRFGADDQLRNIAPALVVGFAWPVLVLASALLGDVWRWVNPWDTLARALGGVAPDDPDPAPEPDARWALPAAVAWVWYLHLYGQSLSPRAVGAALAAYTIVTVSGCLAVGRRRWFARAEVFTLLFGWVAKIRRGGLLAWTPPRGADLVLGVLAGGALFTMVRISDLWRPLGQGTRPQLWAVVGLVACCAGAAGLLRLLERRARRLGSGGAVTAAAVPTVAALIVAVGLSRSRLPSAAQLLAVLASDPFGRGWDLFGTADLPVHPNPLTTTGLVLTQVLVLCAGGVASAVIARRRTEPRGDRSTTQAAARRPALVPVCVLVGVGVLAVTAI